MWKNVVLHVVNIIHTILETRSWFCLICFLVLLKVVSCYIPHEVGLPFGNHGWGPHVTCKTITNWLFLAGPRSPHVARPGAPWFWVLAPQKWWINADHDVSLLPKLHQMADCWGIHRFVKDQTMFSWIPVVVCWILPYRGSTKTTTLGRSVRNPLEIHP